MRQVRHSMTRTLIPMLLLGLLASTVYPRQFKTWGYSELSKKSDIIAIATPDATRATGTVISKLRNERGEDEGYLRDSRFEEVVTTFSVIAVLKGSPKLTTIDIRHYRMHKDSPLVHGPHLISFALGPKDRYLLFLVAAPNDCLDPIAGHVDPGISIIRLDDHDQLRADIE